MSLYSANLGQLHSALIDNDASVYKPSSLGTKTWEDVHTEFFNKFYQKGFQNARNRLVDYATFMKTNGDAATLSDDKQAVITDLVNNPEKYCNSTFQL